MSDPIIFWYKNYRGEQGYRRAIPISLRFGASDWHKESQWLLLAFDTQKGAEREFALRDISGIVGFPTIQFAAALHLPHAPEGARQDD